MFAGKTEALIARAFSVRHRRVLKPTTDTRNGESSHLLSHGGLSIAAEWVDPDLERLPNATTIFIDEAQFLTAAAVERVRRLQPTTNITLAGLDLTAQGRPFGNMAEFLCLADEVIKLTGGCATCGRPSTRTRCKIVQTDVVMIGGAEAYEPLCQTCFSQ